jgi:NAD+ synthase
MKRSERIVEWLRERVSAAGARGLVVGLSGGVDSSLTAALCKRAFPDDSLGVILGCHSLPQDAEHARLAARSIGLPFVEVPLEPVYDAFLAQLGAGAAGAASPEGDRLARANLKPRLRMAALYFHANLRGYLVAGTGNRSELELGYFTKYGDGGVDLLPLGGLVKSEVRALAREVGVPQPIIDKPPSAGLWEGQTDEGEMGLAYEDVDRYILEGEATPAVRARIEALHAASAHKRGLPPVAPA